MNFTFDLITVECYDHDITHIEAMTLIFYLTLIFDLIQIGSMTSDLTDTEIL